MSITKTTILLVALAATASAAVSPQKPMDSRLLGADMLLYPPLARQAGIQGRVEVQVQVDGAGKVVSALPVSGHPLLRSAAVENAKSWRFAPRLNEGTLVYDFKIEGKVGTDDPYYQYGKVIFRPPNSVEIDSPEPVVVRN
jgi:TonB family protein